MKDNLYGLIMAGGVGSRFWPMSRQSYPKQFIDVLNCGKTLIQMTYERLARFLNPDNILIVTNAEYVHLVQDQIPHFPVQNILSEPVGRNTAPCIAYGCFKIQKMNPNAAVLICPSDHLIIDENLFQKIVLEAFEAVLQKNIIMTLGILPTRPDTGYGYIQFEEEDIQTPFYKVKSFTEKPSLEIAQYFLSSGEYLWNSGIFISSVNHLIKEFQRYLPDIHEIFSNIKNYLMTNEEIERVNDAYLKCPNISIDYGIMEKAEQVFVYPASFGWSDLGTWASLYEHIPLDEHQNAKQGNVILFNSHQNMISNKMKDKIIVIEGLDNYIVVDTQDVLMICRKNQEQFIKEVVNQLRKERTYDHYL
ncbi:MAG: mannose-1-phosphate guanylyltransferase [Bacteroidia bacterium]|nr:MAG: mannose-1-phosphate guanylyltransferase [Bacteroidia bacterium]